MLRTVEEWYAGRLSMLRALCPDTHLSFTSAWEDVLRRTFDPDDPLMAEFDTELEEALDAALFTANTEEVE